MSIENKERIERSPELIEELRTFIENGGTLTAAGRRFGVSRDIIRTLLRKYGIEKVYKISQEYMQEDIDLLVRRIIAGENIKDIQAEVHLSKSRDFRALLKKHGYDLEQIKEERSLHLHDGRTFGYWQVIPGTHRAIDAKGERGVTCRCVCGYETEVRLTNLIRGSSQSCGCITYLDRKNTGWQNTNTGEYINTSTAFAERTELSSQQLYFIHRKGECVVDKNGDEWMPVESERFATHGNTWQNTTTNQIVYTTKELAEHIRVNAHTLTWRILKQKDKTRHVDPQGNTWVKIDAN